MTSQQSIIHPGYAISLPSSFFYFVRSFARCCFYLTTDFPVSTTTTRLTPRDMTGLEFMCQCHFVILSNLLECVFSSSFPEFHVLQPLNVHLSDVWDSCDAEHPLIAEFVTDTFFRSLMGQFSSFFILLLGSSLCPSQRWWIKIFPPSSSSSTAGMDDVLGLHPIQGILCALSSRFGFFRLFGRAEYKFI